MIALLQRVLSAKIVISNKTFANINKGILCFIGIEKFDNEDNANKLLNRILGYRIFEDQQEKMNLNIQDINGELLLVPQFTLAADTKKGMRASFSTTKNPDDAKILFQYLLSEAKKKYEYKNVKSGEFQADMKVHLINDGPVTFYIKG